MHPAFLDNMSWEMAEVYGAITDQILINLAKHFSYFEVDTVPKSVFDYQARMLAQMGQVNKETIRIIKNGLVDADLALQDVLEQAVIDAVKGAEPELLDGVKRGVFQMPTTPIPSANQTRAFKLYYQQAANKLNLVNTVMLESTQAAYQQTISNVIAEIDLADRMYRTQIALDTAAGETITGVSSWNTALKHATDRLKEGGITGFVDHAGHQWSAEAYVAMDIRTTVFNTGRAAVWETNQDFGNDLYLVSYHNGARPLCYPWQNKVISSTDSARTVVDLDGNEIQVIAQSDTSYGAPAGLFGINCKHYPMPFIPGVSVIDGKPQDKEENDKAYAESQEQRRLERKLREEKRDLQMMKAQGASEEDIAKQREKVKQSSADIDDFCNSTGRARHRDREAVYTKREFPDADRYDVTQFAQDQKNLVENYYLDGGEQKGFTAGKMTPNVPVSNEPITNVSEPSRNGVYSINDAAVESRNVTITNTFGTVYQGEADVYKMPDGTEFVFKKGMNPQHQHLTPEALIDRYYQAPQELRNNGQKLINVVDNYNPDDNYWRQTYKNFPQSYATGGEKITFYRYDKDYDLDYAIEAMEHEMGHNLDRINGNGSEWFSELAEWQNAMAADKKVSGLDSISEYGTNSSKEDFAVSVQNYYKMGKVKLAEKIPNRTAIIERLLGLGAKP